MRRAIVVALILLAAFAAWLGWPLSRRGLAADPHPATSYADALRRVEALRAADSPAISADCVTRLFTHGARTTHVIVMLHGLTNCPQQFDSLGRVAFARGANVLVPRLPLHGFADRLTDQLAHADAGAWRAFTDRVLDAAHGLGDTVTVVGLSVGGTLATWAAQERPDVERAVLIAPMLGVERAPGNGTPIVSRLFATLPNLFWWWDPVRREHLLGPKHVYPRFATRAVAATLRIGWLVVRDADRRGPGCRSFAMITVGGDQAVDNGLCARVATAWRRHGASVATYEFPAALHLSHDVVDPEQAGGNPAITYPVLERWILPASLAPRDAPSTRAGS